MKFDKDDFILSVDDFDDKKILKKKNKFKINKIEHSTYMDEYSFNHKYKKKQKNSPL